MRSIIFLNNKGGVGKTASTTTIAHMMAEHFGKKVLMVDLDPQMNMTSLYGEVDFMELFRKIRYGTITKTRASVEDILLDREMDIHECIQHTGYTNLDLLPAYLTLSEAEERLKADVRTPQQFRLKTQLAKIKDEYDICIMDASPSLSILNINGLAAADDIYIPLKCDGYSLIGTAISMNLVNSVKEYNPQLRVGGMFFTQWNGRKNVAKGTRQILENEYGEYLLPFSIASSKNVEESSLMQTPLLAYEGNGKKSKTCEDYLRLTEYILAH